MQSSIGGTPWHYVLIPYDTIAENMTLDFLLKQFGQRFFALPVGNPLYALRAPSL
ncbi:MAG: hypothetical protein V7676_16790 [Parasphingorhabdus sp.]|uniref:hypothetical protein n=1 Tax=Parasphingorhabdus sp. TaxID=2709688 RepID=UPI0030031F64